MRCEIAAHSELGEVQKSAAEALGWDPSMWEAGIVPDQLLDTQRGKGGKKAFVKLSGPQSVAATSLGFTAETWNQEDQLGVMKDAALRSMFKWLAGFRFNVRIHDSVTDASELMELLLLKIAHQERETMESNAEARVVRQAQDDGLLEDCWVDTQAASDVRVLKEKNKMAASKRQSAATRFIGPVVTASTEGTDDQAKFTVIKKGLAATTKVAQGAATDGLSVLNLKVPLSQSVAAAALNTDEEYLEHSRKTQRDRLKGTDSPKGVLAGVYQLLSRLAVEMDKGISEQEADIATDERKFREATMAALKTKVRMRYTYEAGINLAEIIKHAGTIQHQRNQHADRTVLELTWARLTTEERKNLGILGYSGKDGPEKWDDHQHTDIVKDKTFEDLSEEEQKAAKALKFDTITWNEWELRESWLHRVTFTRTVWSELDSTQKKSAGELGFSTRRWYANCAPRPQLHFSAARCGLRAADSTSL